MIINLSNKFTETNKLFRLPVIQENFVQNYEIQYNRTVAEEYTDISKINDRIFIGGEFAAADLKVIHDNNISHIINMAIDGIAYDHTGIKIMNIHIWDGGLAPNGALESAANLLNDILKSESDNILVHCAAGISRSTTVVLSYLILHTGMSFYDALRFIEASRPCVAPHPLLVRSMFRDFGNKIKLS